MSLGQDIDEFKNYIKEFYQENIPTTPLGLIVASFLFKLVNTGLPDTNSSTTELTTLLKDIKDVDLREIQANQARNSTKQDETVAAINDLKTDLQLLQNINQQLDFANSIGAVQPSQSAIASFVVLEILPQSGTRKTVTITNHSLTDSIVFDLNGDASVGKGQILLPNSTWESPGAESARSRITVISSTGSDIPFSYQSAYSDPFIIQEPKIILDLDIIQSVIFPIYLLKDFSNFKVSLINSSDTLIASFEINSFFKAYKTIDVIFNDINISVVNQIVPNFFYLMLDYV